MSEIIRITLETIGDAELHARLKRLASVERRALVLLLAHLAEFDRRKLHADRGHPSLFAYCTKELGYSEQGAYKRIQAARAIQDHPALLDHLAKEKINLATIVVLAPHLRPDNVEQLLDSARGLTIREVERIAAGVSPRQDAPDLLRALPGPAHPPPRAASTINANSAPVTPRYSAPRRPAEALEPLSDRRYLFRFSGGTELRLKLEKAAVLLRLALGEGTMETIFEKSLDALLSRIDPLQRKARRRSGERPPVSARRRISAALRDEVWARDGGRCTFIGPSGDRCTATQWLEIDHIVPFSRGGRSDAPSNLRLLCRAHNQLAARRVLGGDDYPRG